MSITRREFGVLGAGTALGLVGARAVAQAAPEMKATIANAAGNLNLATQATLKQEKFLEKFGVDGTFLNVADGSKILGGLVGGDLDASMMSGFGQVFPAIERGAKLKIIAAASFAPSLSLFTSKPYVKSLKDLEGRTVGTGSLGALLHHLTVALLKKNNVDVSKVKFVNIGSSGDVFRATVAGTVDAGTGESSIIDDMSHYPNTRLVPGGNMTLELPEYTYQASWTSDRVLEAKRDVLVRCLAAQAKLYRFLHDPNSKDAFLKARASVLPKSPPADALAQWNYIQKYKPFATELMMSDERLAYMQQLNVDVHVQHTVLKPERVADMSLVKEALALVAKSG